MVQKINRKYLAFVQFIFWPIFLLIQLGAPSGFRDFLRAKFWLNMAFGLLILIAAAGVLAGCFYAYYRFCLWFNRAIDAARSRTAERIAIQNGEIIWSASHPLHDSELDG